LDYCAGAGGKALLFSSFMKDTGQLYLHDVNQFALKKA
jgi:16S rRNA C967 or C1407 C5-methylase (RsmB/RsmF family)